MLGCDLILPLPLQYTCSSLGSYCTNIIQSKMADLVSFHGLKIMCSVPQLKYFSVVRTNCSVGAC